MRWIVNLKRNPNNPEVPIPYFVRTANQETPDGKIAMPGKPSGHITYQLKNAEPDGLPHFFKLNKKGKRQLTMIEVMMTALWNWALPEYTSKSELVFKPVVKRDAQGILQRNYRIVGIISKSIPAGGNTISREFNPNGDDVDQFSFARHSR